MKITAQTLVKNPKFIALLESMEEPILQVTKKVFNLNKEERETLSKEMKPIITALNLGKLKPEKIPTDLVERFGSNKASNEKLMKAAKAFVESLKLTKAEMKSGNFNKKKLRLLVKEATETLEFHRNLADEISDLPMEPNLPELISVRPTEEECLSTCNEIFKVNLIALTLRFILNFIPCFILGWLTFLWGKDLCWITSIADYIYDLLEAMGEFIACTRRCSESRT